MTQLSATDGAPRPDAACPMARFGAAYRPFEQAGMHALFARAQTEAPVFHCPEINYWVVARRADVLAVFRDPARFSAAIALAPVRPLPASVVQRLAEGGYRAAATQVSADPPVHGRIRQYAGRLLSLKTFAPLEPAIRRLVREAADALPAASSSGRADMVADFAYELPARVVFLLLGAPDADVPKIKQWGDDRLLFTFGELDEPAMLRAADRLVDYWRYCVAMVEDRKAAPRDDYASHLLALRDGDDARMTENEVASLVFGLLLAGHETTSNMTANALDVLLRHPEQWRALHRDPALIPNAVEECLRHHASVVCWRRRALVDVRVGDQDIPAGANLLLALAGANRDPEHFPEPDAFDIRRPNARDHLSFGHGAHFCLGAPLARLELRIILEELAARFPDMRLAEPERAPAFIRTIAFRGPVALPVLLG